MAIVTDGLDRDTLARYRAQLVAVRAPLDALYAATEAESKRTTDQRFARFALGNAVNGLDSAVDFLNQARDELPQEGE